jgi:hypothetical protein
MKTTGSARSISGMGDEPLHLRPALSFLRDRLAQVVDAWVEPIQQLQQFFSPPASPSRQRQRFQLRPPLLAPQATLAPHPFVHGDGLQLVHHPRPHPHQAMSVPYQLP